MRIGLIADVHGNLEALTQVLQELDAQDVALTLCAGDITCYGANNNEVIALLRERGIPTVVGNYDDAVAWGRATASRLPSRSGTDHLKRQALVWAKATLSARHIPYLRGLPWTIEHRVDGLRVSVWHAGVDYLDEWVTPAEPERLTALVGHCLADVIVLGHTHEAFAHTHQGALVVNPGPVGRSLDGDPRAAFAILETETRLVQFYRIEYDIERAVAAIAHSGMPIEIAQLVRLGARSLQEIGARA